MESWLVPLMTGWDFNFIQIHNFVQIYSAYHLLTLTLKLWFNIALY